jgi:hypothetical protein
VVLSSIYVPNLVGQSHRAAIPEARRPQRLPHTGLYAAAFALGVPHFPQTNTVHSFIATFICWITKGRSEDTSEEKHGYRWNDHLKTNPNTQVLDKIVYRFKAKFRSFWDTILSEPWTDWALNSSILKLLYDTKSAK